MYAIGIGQFGGAVQCRDMQVAFHRRGWAYAYRFIGEADVFQGTVCGGMYRDRLDAHFTAGTQYPQCDFAAVGNDDFFEHGDLLDDEQHLVEFDRAAVFHQDGTYLAALVGLDLVHHFHRFDDAQGIASINLLALGNKGSRSR